MTFRDPEYPDLFWYAQVKEKKKYICDDSFAN